MNKEDAITEYKSRSKALEEIIRPLRNAVHEVDYLWNDFRSYFASFADEYGGLEMNPDFQRGHVWDDNQRRHFIENVLRGMAPSSSFLVQFNCPNFDNFDYVGDLPRGLQCVDGLQRITAICDFLDGKVKPFGLTIDDLKGSRFSIGSRHRFRIAIHAFQKKTDLLQHYLDINSGGTPHSEQEIARIKQMKEDLLNAASTAKPSRPRP